MSPSRFRHKAVSAAMTFAALVGGLPGLSQGDTADLAEGKRIYLESCRACHGADGKGSGVMTFNPPAADLTSPQVQNKLDARLYNSIHEGRPNTAMGAWKHSLSAKDVLDVMAYVRTFRGNSSQR